MADGDWLGERDLDLLLTDYLIEADIESSIEVHGFLSVEASLRGDDLSEKTLSFCLFFL